MPTREEYEAAFRTEHQNVYPNITEFEKRIGRAIHPALIEQMAAVLACPVKASPPNWQHGRVVYAEARRYLAEDNRFSKILCFVDIGTAKGFSALCMAWAIKDSGLTGKVLSYDVIDPASRESRNSILDVVGREDLPTVFEFIAPFRPEGVPIFLMGKNDRPTSERRIHFAFVDGKHNYLSVKNDADSIRVRQQKGDVIIFDDLQIEGVALAVAELTDYQVETLEAHPGRRYAIARRSA